ncbi:DUF2948 family protein [Candidatus Finniella inopinata]|uniref:DUF2948 family protein n=1 Tax=Candidatus Finniella inopinata TaxID=1696036 RepID=A0A4Q7DLU9_9PROT|nr:DUF2948 family protein [Candidatus Finniella inopinata]RZI45736.1 DUF2948 family protein [Candidatus Finniella inopinata]
MTHLNFVPLKLLATSAEDLSIVSTQLQDGLLSLTSLEYDQESKRVTGLINWFCWEHAHEHKNEQGQLDSYYRVHAGFCIHHVESMHMKGFHQGGGQRMFNLLTLTLGTDLTLTLVCSGEHSIKLKIMALYVQLADLDQPWPAAHKPKHLHEYVDDFDKKRA